MPSDAHSRCSKTPVRTDRRTSAGAPSVIRAASVTVGSRARPLPTGRPAPPARAGPACVRAGRRRPHGPGSPHTPRSRRVAHAAGAVSPGAHGKDGVAAALSRRTCCGPAGGEQHGFLCLRGHCPLQHETQPFWCKHLCFIRFTLFLFFYFELYTFEK